MGLLADLIKALFGQKKAPEPRTPAKRKKQQHRRTTKEIQIASFDNERSFSLAVAGESNYLPALKRAKNIAPEAKAILMREPDNNFDENAVAVMLLINGNAEKVGYLSRDNAEDYCDALDSWEDEGYYVSCQAILLGGDAERSNIGVWLDLSDAEKIEEDYEKQFLR